MSLAEYPSHSYIRHECAGLSYRHPSEQSFHSQLLLPHAQIWKATGDNNVLLLEMIGSPGFWRYI